MFGDNRLSALSRTVVSGVEAIRVLLRLAVGLPSAAVLEGLLCKLILLPGSDDMCQRPLCHTHHFLPESLRVYLCVCLCACSAGDDEFLLVSVPSRGFPAQGMPCVSAIIHGARLGRTTAMVGGGQKDKASVSKDLEKGSQTGSSPASGSSGGHRRAPLGLQHQGVWLSRACSLKGSRNQDLVTLV